MRLDDAWVGCSLDPALACEEAPQFCSQLIANGCDIVACPGQRVDLLELIAPVCAREDALLLAVGGGGQAVGDGILLEGGAGLGLARATLGDYAVVGCRVTSTNEAMLVLELGVGFLLYSGQMPVAAVGELPGAVGVPLFVVGGQEAAADESGRYRLWVEASAGVNAPKRVRECSQMLGRIF
jgi:hypothetical protein